MHSGIFKDIEGYNWTVTIDGTTGTHDLQFSGTPFTTSMSESDDIIYKPAKYQGGTIGLLSQGTDYLFDLYTSDPQGRKVTVIDFTNQVAWVGYITPSLYDIGYAKAVEPLSVDCVDGLSTLSYYKYEPIGAEAGIHSLLDIIRHCVAKCGCYSTIIYYDTTTIDGNGAEVTAGGYMSESDFIRFDAAETDNKDTKTYQEVLESVCQWLGVTAVAQGDAVYLMDYDEFIRASGSVSGKVVDVSTGTVTSLLQSVSDYLITGESYANSSTHLSLDNVYNKVSVVDDLKTFDAVLIDYFQDVTNITADDPDIVADHWRGQVGEYVQPGNGDNMLVMIRSVDGVQNSTAYNAIFAKYYKSPYYKFYRYTGSSNTATTTYDNAMNFTDTKKFNGAALVRMDVQRLENTDFVGNWIDNVITGQTPLSTLDEILANNEISSIQLSDYIFMMNHKTTAGDNITHISNADIASYPYFETTTPIGATSFFGGANAYLVIQGTIIWHDDNNDLTSFRNNSSYPIPDGEVDIDHGRYKIDASKAYLLCKLQWGTKYWNGESWTSTNSTFKVFFEKDNVRNDAIMFKNVPLVNTVSWRIGTDEKGYLIPMPQSGAIVGATPKLTVYKPMDFSSYYETRFMALKDFKITPIIADPTYSDNADKDTVYTNVINLASASELDDISFTTCTYDNKKPNYNSVAYIGVDGEYYYTDTVTHRSLSALAAGTVREDGSVSAGELREEEMTVLKVTNQYSAPSKILDLSLNSDIGMLGIAYESNLDTRFVVDKIDRDYKHRIYTVRLIEKK